MEIRELQELFYRDLGRLEKEISQFELDTNIWLTEAGINNSAGNLALHLCGNLNHFIGATLADTGYVRDREAEFNDKNVPKIQILESITRTQRMVDNAFDSFTLEQMKKTYPIELWNKQFTAGFFLMHLYGHLNYHLGQINYIRRILEG